MCLSCLHHGHPCGSVQCNGWQQQRGYKQPKRRRGERRTTLVCCMVVVVAEVHSFEPGCLTTLTSSSMSVILESSWVKEVTFWLVPWYDSCAVASRSFSVLYWSACNNTHAPIATIHRNQRGKPQLCEILLWLPQLRCTSGDTKRT